MTAELVLATLLESARLGDSGPATVAANARRRVDTPGGGGQIPGDTPWHPGQAMVLSKWICCLPGCSVLHSPPHAIWCSLSTMSCKAYPYCRGP